MRKLRGYLNNGKSYILNPGELFKTLEYTITKNNTSNYKIKSSIGEVVSINKPVAKDHLGDTCYLDNILVRDLEKFLNCEIL